MKSNFILILFYLSQLIVHDHISAQVIVPTSSGRVKGKTIRVLNKVIDQFLGIPYAIPPIGDLRFAKPKPFGTPLKGIIDATKLKYSCVQPVTPIANLSQSEDCLTLNIWSPKQNWVPFFLKPFIGPKLKPVMFWIYGGGLTIGSIYYELFDGSILVTHDIVFVAANYRVGKFGFLYGNDSSAPGNVGFYDQLLALKWVRDNIHRFGGDKNQITIFGQSAGSWSVSAQLVSPLSKGLFKRAIMESGAFMFNKDRPVLTKAEALIEAKNLAKGLNCTDDKKWLKCLRKADPKYFVPTDSTVAQLAYPVFGTEFLPLTEYQAFRDRKFNKDIDLLAGVNRDEGTSISSLIMPDYYSKLQTKQLFDDMFDLVNSIMHNLDRNATENFYLNDLNISDPLAMKWAINNFTGDLGILCPTYVFAKRYAQLSSQKTNIYFYELTHSAMGKAYEDLFGVTHGAEMSFTFGQIILDPKSTQEDVDFSKRIMNYWTDFAKYGKPDSKWPKMIDTKTKKSIIKDLNPKFPDKYFTDLFAKTCDGFWANYF